MVGTDYKLYVCCTCILLSLLVADGCNETTDCSPTPTNCSIAGIGKVGTVADKRPGRGCCRVCPKDFMEKCGRHDHCYNDANGGSKRYVCVKWGSHEKERSIQATGYCLRRSCSKNCKSTDNKTCSSNGQYYSQCFMGRRNCYSNTTVKFVNEMSICDDRCKKVTCADDKNCVKGRCVCKSLTECERDNHPICASDHKTYTSVCHMRVTSCRRNLGLKVISDGPCEPNGSGEDSF